MERATTELRQAGDTISTQSEKLGKIAHLKSSIKSPEDIVSFHRAGKNELKNELAVVIKGRTWLSQLAADIRVEVADMRDRSGAKNIVMPSVIEDLYASSRPSSKVKLRIYV